MMVPPGAGRQSPCGTDQLVGSICVQLAFRAASKTSNVVDAGRLNPREGLFPPLGAGRVRVACFQPWTFQELRNTPSIRPLRGGRSSPATRVTAVASGSFKGL